MTCVDEYLINKISVKSGKTLDLKSDLPRLEAWNYDFLSVLPWAIFLTWASELLTSQKFFSIKWGNIYKVPDTEAGIQNFCFFQ